MPLRWSFSGYRFLIEDWSDEGRVTGSSSGFSTLTGSRHSPGFRLLAVRASPVPKGSRPNPTSEVEARWEDFAIRFFERA